MQFQKLMETKFMSIVLLVFFILFFPTFIGLKTIFNINKLWGEYWVQQKKLWRQ
jgi:hypothetical protein